jgi:hypothetical protein
MTQDERSERMTTTHVITPDPRDLLVPQKGTVHNRAAQLVREGDREVVRLDARPEHGLAWWHEVVFETGMIAFELRGKNELQRSLVGVAFHGAQAEDLKDDLSYGDGLSYEAVYFRPFNFVAEDPARRRHMVQYVFPSERHWQRLRQEQPGRFERPVQPMSDPDDWFAARVDVTETTVRVYVGGSGTPSLASSGTSCGSCSSTSVRRTSRPPAGTARSRPSSCGAPSRSRGTCALSRSPTSARPSPTAI